MRGKGRVFPRAFSGGIRWYIAYCAPKDGRSVERREAAGDTEEDARRLLDERLHELRNHEQGIRRFSGPDEKRVTFAELIEDLETDYAVRGKKSARVIRSHIKHLLGAFGKQKAVRVTTDAVRRYLQARQRAKAAPATIDHETELLRRAFNLGIENGKISFAPKASRLLKTNENARQGFLDRSDFDAILGGIPDADFRDYLEWFWWTGMRPGEIGSLTWESYDRETSTLRLHASDAKIGQGRVVPIMGPLAPIIQRRLAARRFDCRLVFHSNGVAFKVENGGLPSACYGMWFSAVEAAGLPGRKAPRGERLIPYDLRRTAARNLRAAGVPERVIMEITGHKTRSMFDRYGIVDERDMRNAFESVGRYVDSLPTDRKVTSIQNSPANSAATL